MINNIAYLGLAITVLGYFIGLKMKNKFHSPIFSPILIAVIFSIICLLVLQLDYNAYSDSNKIITMLLTPATICLAVPLYEQVEILKKNFITIMISILTGVLMSALSIFAISYFTGLDHTTFVSLLPKSITTAIGMGLSEEMGGIVPITVISIILTGILGNIIIAPLCKLFKIHNPIAVGLAHGTASHAIGTAKAIELGEIQGAMSSVSIAISGLLTVPIVTLFSTLL